VVKGKKVKYNKIMSAKKIKETPVEADTPADRRPSAGPAMPASLIEELNAALAAVRDKAGPYAARLRPLDRQRLRGVGIKKRGFIDSAYSLAAENPQLLPAFLTVEKFQRDNEYFAGIRALFDICEQLRDYARNLTMLASDTVYTDALRFYAAAREAAKRRVAGAETVHRKLEPFFTRPEAAGEAPTEKKLKRDANALLRGGRDGKIVIENAAPKAAGGGRRVIDEKFDGNGRRKEAEEDDNNG
jgi:hypothetical protein